MNLKRLLLLLASPFLALTAATVRADVWTPTPIPPKAAGGSRTEHTAVWTGKEMIVWGGAWGSNTVGRGGVYDPVSNTWRPTSTENLPSTYLGGHTAVWAGEPVNRMLVYGGSFPPLGRDGGMYDPETDRWTKIEIDGDRRAKPPIPVPPNVPSFRLNHSAVWTGEEMIVWGGHCLDTCYRTDGAAFNPLTQQWRPIKTPPFLAGRAYHSAFWTGTKMLVWGGRSGGRPYNDGGLYDPKSDEWTPVTMEGVPSLRTNHGAVWTGREMIVWGGQETLVMADGKLKGGLRFRPDGKIYDPVLDRWRPMSTRGLDTNVKKQPAGQEYHTSVWTGEEMITWGGARGSGATHLGYRYNLEADVWVPVTNTGSPTNRDYHTAVWTGREMIIWAGRGGGGGPLSGGYAGPTGGVYRPTCGAYVFEPQEGERVNREVTFRLHLSPASAPRQAQLVVDGAPRGEWEPLQTDSRVKFSLSDGLAGQHKLRVRTGGADGSQCLTPETPVVVGPTVKVLSLVFDPQFEFNGKSYRTTFGWNDPEAMTEDYNKILLEASGGFAKYELVGNKMVTIDGYPRESNGHVSRDEELYNQSRNGGWSNLEGVPQEGRDDTRPNHGFPLGSSAATMRYAQSFRVWGSALTKVRLGLSKVGAPAKPVKVSVRLEPDGEDLCSDPTFDYPRWCGSVVRPEEVTSVSHLAPTYVELTKPDKTHFTLPLEDRLYYLAIQFSDNPADLPDPDNYYVISATRDPGPAPGRPRFTDDEAAMFLGADRQADWDLTVKLAFKRQADWRHLLAERAFEVNGKTQSVAAHVREGTVDEVYAFVGAQFNLAEAAMFGPRAFTLVEGPYLTDLDSGRAFVLMGFNYERVVGLMLHNYGHRTEATMRHVYASWNGGRNGAADPKPVPIENNWDRFSMYKRQVTDRPSLIAGCGNTHNPPNSRRDYDYVNALVARSTCDDWMKYPNLTGASKTVGVHTWGGNPQDEDYTQRFYFKWWYTRLPKAKGCNSPEEGHPQGDRKLNNWWRYIVEPDQYKATPAPDCGAP